MQKALIFVGGVVLGGIGTVGLLATGIVELTTGKKSQRWIMARRNSDKYEKWGVWEHTGEKSGKTIGFYVVLDPDVKYEEKEATADETGSDEDSADNGKAADRS